MLVWVLAGAIVVAGAVVAIAIAMTRGGGGEAAPAPVATVTVSPTPTPSTAPGTQGPTVSTSPAPNPSLETIPTPSAALPPATFEPLPPADGNQTLQANVLYAQPIPTLDDCPAPGTPTQDQEWRDLVREQWRCVHEAWLPVIEEQGWATEMPEVFFFPGAGSKSDCGYFEAPAFYCGRDAGTVYFGGSHFDMAQMWDLSINEMVNHEYGHHLQKLAGITESWNADSSDTRQTQIRRSELQAVCWSAAMTTRNEAVGFDADDYESWGARLETMTESPEHGSRSSLVEWGTRGLYAETAGDCNTWTAPEPLVS